MVMWIGAQPGQRRDGRRAKWTAKVQVKNAELNQRKGQLSGDAIRNPDPWRRMVSRYLVPGSVDE
jgi:phage gp37-like protein